MKIWFRWMWLASFFGALLVCLLCGGPAMAAKEIVIGAVMSVTGPFGADGTEAVWAYRQAVEDYNKKGGIFIKSEGKKLPIRLVLADDESEPAKVAAAMEKLIKIDKVDLILGTLSASIQVSACNAAEKFQVCYHTTCHFPEMWSPQHYRWSSVMFFSASSAANVPFEILEAIKNEDRPKNVALLMEDSPDGQAFGAGFRAHAKEHGVTFAVDEPWAIGAKDYSALILKMKAKNVDAIFLYGAPTDAITLLRQVKEAKLNAKYIHGWKGTWSNEFAEAMGKDVNYIVCDGFWSEDYPYPFCKELGKRYTEKFKKHSVSIGAYYATAQTLLMAIERTKSYDKTAVRNAFRNAVYKGTTEGDLKFDETGFASFPSTGNQWWDGKPMLFYPSVKGGYQLKLAPPWGQR